MVEINAVGLPVLDQDVMNAIYDCEWGIPQDINNSFIPLRASTIKLLNDEYFRAFMNLFEDYSRFNQRYRFEIFRPLFGLVHPIVNLEYNSEGTDVFLSKIFTLQEMYKLKDKELCRLLKLIE